MKQKSSKLCLCMDITALHEWQGTPVGVVRVESELAKSLLRRTDIDVRFARYVPHAGSFVELLRDEVVLLVQGVKPSEEAVSKVQAETKDALAQPSVTSKTKLKALKIRAKAWLFARSPVELQDELQKLFSLGMDLVRTAVGLARHLARAAVHHLTGRSLKALLKKERKPQVQSSDAFLAEVDVYFSCGFDWFSDKLDVLFAKKNQYRFQLHTACHDLIPVRAPQLVGRGVRDFYVQYFTKLLRISDHITCFSAATLHDLKAFAGDMKLQTPALSVSHHGSPVPIVTQKPEAAALAALQGKPFCLTVGTLEPRKNHELLIWIWERFANQGVDIPPLVIIGKKGWEIDKVTRRLEQNVRLRSRLVWLQEVSDNDLAWAYRNCSLFLFPSLYEGWGLPVSEALAYGRPCISSNSSSLPEAGAGRAILLDPRDLPAWSAAIQDFFKGESSAAEPYPTPRSWEDSLRDLLRPWLGNREHPV